MEVRGIERALLVAALALAAGCGGASTRNDDGAESGGSSPATGGGGPLGGSSAVAGAGGQPPSTSPLGDLSLDDSFPWFAQPHGGEYGPLMWAKGGVVNVLFEGAPVETTLSTHNHVQVLGRANGVTFRAKASQPLPLLVSVTSTLDSDYFAARDAGRDWPVAARPVTTEWATFEVPFSDLQPPEDRDPMAMAAFTLAFIVEAESGPVELWLDDIRFF